MAKKNRKTIQLCPTALAGYVLAVMKERLGRCGMSIQDVVPHLSERAGVTVTNNETRAAIEHLSPLISVEGDRVYPSPELLRDESFFETRRQASKLEKRAVAKHIYQNMMTTLGAVFLDGGSACEAIAQEIARGNNGAFTVMTNNRKAFKELMTNPKIRLHLTGGIYRPDDETFVGNEALFNTRRFNVKYAIVGASGVTRDYVYNHDILGEEFIKRHYWQIPAETLIVPATITKFEGKDASCFGRLCYAAPRRDGAPNGDIDQIADQAIQEELAAWWGDRSGDDADDAYVPSFKADRCIIVVEPKWMIEKSLSNEGEDNDRLNSLYAKIGEINESSKATRVTVEFASVSPEDLEK